MAASYRNLWIIVGMTVTATVFANMSAKPKRSFTPNYEVSHREPNLPSTTRIRSETSNSPALPAGTIGNPDRGTATQPASTQPTGVQHFRDIDADFKSSFDMAARIALASQAVQSPAPIEHSAPETALPSLQTREIQSNPKVFELETQSQLDAGSTLGTGLTTTNLNMREGPAANYLLVDTLATGAVVSILEQENGWLHVREVASGRQGWVNGTYIARTNK